MEAASSASGAASAALPKFKSDVSRLRWEIEHQVTKKQRRPLTEAEISAKKAQLEAYETQRLTAGGRPFRALNKKLDAIPEKTADAVVARLTSVENSPGLSKEEQIQEDMLKLRVIQSRLKTNRDLVAKEKLDGKLALLTDKDREKIAKGFEALLKKKEQREEEIQQKRKAAEEKKRTAPKRRATGSQASTTTPSEPCDISDVESEAAPSEEPPMKRRRWKLLSLVKETAPEVKEDPSSDEELDVKEDPSSDEEVVKGSLPASFDRFLVCDGAWVIPNFAQEYLGFDPTAFQEAMLQFPESSDTITKFEPQWLLGDGPSQKYRGNALPSQKLITQISNPADGLWKYKYPGFQTRALYAVSNVERTPLKPILDMYNQLMVDWGLPTSNQQMTKHYRDGSYCIKPHSDDPSDLHEDGLITVVKTGAFGRRFVLECPDVKFDEVLQPGTAVIMTLAANLVTKHSVPRTQAEPSGSLTFRTSKTLVPLKALDKPHAYKELVAVQEPVIQTAVENQAEEAIAEEVPAPVTDEDIDDQLAVVDMLLEGLKRNKKRIAACPRSPCPISVVSAKEYELKYNAAKEKLVELCKRTGKSMEQAESEARQRQDAKKRAAERAAAEAAAKEQADFAYVPTTVEEARAKIDVLEEKWRQHQEVFLHYDRQRSAGYEDADRYRDMYADKKLEVRRVLEATRELLVKLEVCSWAK